MLEEPMFYTACSPYLTECDQLFCIPRCSGRY